MADEFTPLGVREGWTAEGGPYEGAPPHIRGSLLDWFAPNFFRQWRSGSISRSSFDHDLLQQAERRVHFSSGIVRSLTPRESLNRLRSFLAKDEKVLLSVLDFLLWTNNALSVDQVETILEEGGSIYQIAQTTGRPRLERRIEPHLEAIAREEMARSGNASELLKAAWSSTLGRQPNPSEGYQNAIRAVEAAAIPLILPNDTEATLGKVIGHLSANRGGWRFVIPERRDKEPPVQTVIDLMGALWTSQYDRHVREGSALHIGQAEADAALPLAAVLVHWLQTGALQREP